MVVPGIFFGGPLHDRLCLSGEMAQATLYYNCCKSPSTATEIKSADLANTCFFCAGTPYIACHKCKVLHCTLHASILCQSEICVRLRQFWVANLAAADAFVVVAATDVHTHPGVWMCCKWYAVPPQYPQNADGQLRNVQEFCCKGNCKKVSLGCAQFHVNVM